MEAINILAFKNNSKTKDTQPDYSGTSRDKKFRIAIWNKESKQNPGEMNLSVKVTDNDYKKPA
jgi:hypothetical protein